MKLRWDGFRFLISAMGFDQGIETQSYIVIGGCYNTRGRELRIPALEKKRNSHPERV